MAYPKKADVDAGYDRLTRILLEKESESAISAGRNAAIFRHSRLLAAMTSNEFATLRV